MTEETQSYPDEQAWRDAMKRGATRPSTGWRAISNSRDRLEITWNNDPPPPPTPLRPLTLPAFVDELAAEHGVEIVGGPP